MRITPIQILFPVIGYGTIEQSLMNMDLVNARGRMDFSEAYCPRRELAARAHKLLTHHRVHFLQLGNDLPGIQGRCKLP